MADRSPARATARTAALAAPFKPNDVSLLAIISDFDAAYAAYNGFQGAIERYWALRSLQQDDIARARRDGDEGRPGPRRHAAAGVSRRRRGAACRAAARVRVRIGALDLLTLDLHASVIARLDDGRGRRGRRRAEAEDDERRAPARCTIAIDVAEAEPGIEPAADRRAGAGLRLALPARFSTLQVALAVSVAVARRAAAACASSTRRASTACSRTRRSR